VIGRVLFSEDQVALELEIEALNEGRGILTLGKRVAFMKEVTKIGANHSGGDQVAIVLVGKQAAEGCSGSYDRL